MWFAKPRIDIHKVMRKDRDFILVWIPMIKITYITKSKKYEMCFDGYTPPKLNQPEAYVLLMRNPRHIKAERGRPDIGIILEPLTDGRRIFEVLKELKKIAFRFVEETREAMRKIPRRLILQLFVPAQVAEAKKIATSDEYIQIYALLDAINIEQDSKYVSEEILYWPLLIHHKEKIVFEPALQDSPSKSYTYLHQKFDLVEIYADETSQ